MSKLALTALLLAAIQYAPSAKAEPKAYQFIFDKKISEVACLEAAIKVAAHNQLIIQPKDESGDHGLNTADGERAGVAYYSERTCHIYVF